MASWWRWGKPSRINSVQTSGLSFTQWQDRFFVPPEDPDITPRPRREWWGAGGIGWRIKVTARNGIRSSNFCTPDSPCFHPAGHVTHQWQRRGKKISECRRTQYSCSLQFKTALQIENILPWVMSNCTRAEESSSQTNGTAICPQSARSNYKLTVVDRNKISFFFQLLDKNRLRNGITKKKRKKKFSFGVKGSCWK